MSYFIIINYIYMSYFIINYIYMKKKQRSDQVVEATGAVAGEEGSNLQRGVANVLLMCC